MKRFLAAAALFLATAAPALAGDAAVGAIQVKNAWSRAAAASAPAGGAFLTIVNTGTAPDRLTAASAPVAGTVELHTHVKDGEVMRMRAVPAIDLAAGQTVQLAPGGLHNMLIGLKQKLEQGSTFPLTLTFEKAGTVTVPVDVLPAGHNPAMMQQHMMHHGQ